MSFLKRLLGGASESRRQPQSAGEDKLEKFIRNNLWVANRHAEEMQRKTDAEAREYVKTIFDTYDVVLGFWNEGGQAGFFALNGDPLLQEAIASAVPVTLKISSILCSRADAEVAELRQRGSIGGNSR
jgi:hypothetical protein